MKKYIYILILFNFAFSQFEQTGNDFIDNYPHNYQNWKNLSPQEKIFEHYYRGYIIGYLEGNQKTAIEFGDYEEKNIVYKLSGMDIKQVIRLLKKWCDDNPQKTHLPLYDIIWEVANNLE